jgi:biopolymer transport protein ExbD
MSSNFGSSSNSQDVDINITPIIDCFTVLITFLLASASFLSIGFLEASTPGSTSDVASAEPNTEAVIRLKKDHTADLNVKGKKNLTLHFDLKSPTALPELEKQIDALVAEHLALNQVLVSAEDEVDYKELANLMGSLSNSKLPLVVGDF